MFNIIDYASGEKADMIIRKDTAFHRAEFSRRVRRHTDDGELVFVSAEDAILSNLIWSQRSGSERQLEDAAQMLHRLAGDLDEEYLQRWSEELRLADLLHRCRGEA